MSMVTSFISTSNMNTSVAQLGAWLTSQAIHVPPGWIDACVAWLAEEHGGIDACSHLTKSDWCQLIYEQWLHSDLKQLACPVLPSVMSAKRSLHDNSRNNSTSTNTISSPALKLDGELCLQVVNLFNINESYYGQLRRHEGNLSVNLPSLEADGENNPDGHTTQMTQAFSQYINQSGTQANNARQSTTTNCLTLILTDGVNEIKVIEFGIKSSTGSRPLTFNELSKKFRPGVKIRLRGPLLLRNNVLIVPPGALQSLSSHQLEVLGGEVDELLENYEENAMYELGKQLANKLNIPLSDNNNLPSWFPHISRHRSSSLEGPNDEQSNHVSTVQQNCSNNVSNRETNPIQIRDSVRSVPVTTISTGGGSVSPQLWDDETIDDTILSHAAQSMEKQLDCNTRGGSNSRRSINSFNDPLRLPPSIIHEERQDHLHESEVSSYEEQTRFVYGTHATFNGSSNNVSVSDDYPFLEDQVDPDLLASALAEIDNQQSADHTKCPKTNQSKVNEIRTFQPVTKISATTATASSISFLSSSSTVLTKSSALNQLPKLQNEPKQSLKQTLLKLQSRNPLANKVNPSPPLSPPPSPSSSSSNSLLAKTDNVKSGFIKVPTNIDCSEDLLPPVPKRKTLELTQSGSIESTSKFKSTLQASTSLSRCPIVPKPTECDNKEHEVSSQSSNSMKIDYHFHPFCYIQDIYHNLLKTENSSNKSTCKNTVYTIRGLLISLLSSLEHHQGTKWTLAVRITDGSAILDLDVSSDLLTEWIGLTPHESESLRRMSKVDANSSDIQAVQEAQKHRQRLRNALTNFQTFLSHLGGLFSITIQSSQSYNNCNEDDVRSELKNKESTIDNNMNQPTVRPMLIGYREMDQCWLEELQRRINVLYKEKSLF
ncbi:RecQ-mediated genome instability protein 1 [Schistosoma japonicum]|nr:RecQ-mediated genome instability protein 1 [Schistosoma japonicum]